MRLGQFSCIYLYCGDVLEFCNRFVRVCFQFLFCEALQTICIQLENCYLYEIVKLYPGPGSVSIKFSRMINYNRPEAIGFELREMQKKGKSWEIICLLTILWKILFAAPRGTSFTKRKKYETMKKKKLNKYYRCAKSRHWATSSLVEG